MIELALWIMAVNGVLQTAWMMWRDILGRRTMLDADKRHGELHAMSVMEHGWRLESRKRFEEAYDAK